MIGFSLDMPWLLAVLLAVAVVIGWTDFLRRRRRFTDRLRSPARGDESIVYPDRAAVSNFGIPVGDFLYFAAGGVLIIVSIWFNFFWLNWLAVMLGVWGQFRANRNASRTWVLRTRTDLDRAGSAWGLFWTVITGLGCTVVSGLGAYLFVLGLLSFLGM